jgi:hypothetical protein
MVPIYGVYPGLGPIMLIVALSYGGAIRGIGVLLAGGGVGAGDCVEVVDCGAAG